VVVGNDNHGAVASPGERRLCTYVISCLYLHENVSSLLLFFLLFLLFFSHHACLLDSPYFHVRVHLARRLFISLPRRRPLLCLPACARCSLLHGIEKFFFVYLPTLYDTARNSASVILLLHSRQPNTYTGRLLFKLEESAINTIVRLGNSK